MRLPFQGAGCGGIRHSQGGASLAVGLWALRGCPFRAPHPPPRTQPTNATTNAFRPNPPLSATKLAIWPPYRGRGVEIPHRPYMSQYGEKHRNQGFVHVFGGLREQKFDTFCPISEGRQLRSRLFCDVVFHYLFAF